MVGLIQGMGFIILTWCVVGAIFTGVGVLAYRAVGHTVGCIADIFWSFWIGWLLIVAYAQLWNLFLRIDMWVWALPALVGAYGLYRQGRRMDVIIVRGVAHHPIAALLVGLLALWTANHAMAPIGDYDAGLYHLSAVRWITTYPAVPGLGNLSYCLANNTSSFDYMAMLDIGPWAGRVYNVADSLLLVVFLSQCMVSLARVCRSRKGNQAHPTDTLLSILLIPMVVYTFTLGYGVAVMNNDIIVFIVQVLVAVQLLHTLAPRDLDSGDASRRLYLMSLLVAVGITLKLTFAVFGAVAMTIVLTLFVMRWRQAWATRPRFLAIPLTIGVSAVVPWIIHGVVLTGYLAFPMTALALPVDWRMPVGDVKFDAGLMLGFARVHGSTWHTSLGNWHWVLPWLKRVGQTFVMPIIIFAVVLIIAPLLSRHQKGVMKNVWLFLTPPVIALIAWFIMSPDPRYAAALFWLLPAGVIALAFSHVISPILLEIIAAVALCAVISTGGLARYAMLPIPPGPEGGLYPLPVVPLHIVTTLSQLRLYVPVYGDQVWDALLPSTPYPSVLLQRRCAQTLRCGFRVTPIEHSQLASLPVSHHQGKAG